jgi:hypothetical protein
MECGYGNRRGWIPQGSDFAGRYARHIGAPVAGGLGGQHMRAIIPNTYGTVRAGRGTVSTGRAYSRELGHCAWGANMGDLRGLQAEEMSTRDHGYIAVRISMGCAISQTLKAE